MADLTPIPQTDSEVAIQRLQESIDKRIKQGFNAAEDEVCLRKSRELKLLQARAKTAAGVRPTT